MTSGRSSTAKVIPILRIFVKIGPVDVEIIGLTEITKNYKRQMLSSTALREERVG